MLQRKTHKWLSLLLVMMMVIAPMITVEAATIDISITQEEPTVNLSEEGERIFDVSYAFGVNFDATATGLDLVLVLDRSNSMLRLDPSTDLPVADAVWEAVNVFVTEYYTQYPDSNVAVVSFGTNANKSDNWKYYDNLEETLEEIVEVYEYRDLYNNYHSNYQSYWNNGYRYAWENWNISDGATNIASAFDYSARTTEMKTTVTKDNDQDVIILFTDGVATQGGSNSQKNYNYPTSHNTNTIAAYEAGIEAQSAGEVIAVGYFEGISYESTKEVARDTLMRSQDAGFFEASQTGQLTGIFEDIVEELNYAGTNAYVTEVIEDEFEVVTDSIYPEDYELSTDNQGRTVIRWQLGNVIVSDYSFGYQVKVKDHVYPTGSGTVKIPINLEAELTYIDLDGNTVTEYLGQNETTIPPMSNQPLVEVTADYIQGFGYLVGDLIPILHDMSFTNEAPFDYREILVRDATKTISGGTFGTDISISQDSLNNGWGVDGDYLVYDIQSEESVTGNQNLEWTGSAGLTLVANAPGSYQLGTSVDYRLINSADLAFNFANNVSDSNAISVREGVLRLVMTDDYGDPVENANVLVDGASYPGSYDSDLGQFIVTGIPSGNHNITFQVPSGYAFDTAEAGVVLVDDDIAFTENYSYSNYDITKTMNFLRLDIRNIAVTDRLGASISEIDQVVDSTEAIVTFELIRPLVKVGMDLVDDYGPTDMHFTLDQSGGSVLVVGPSGPVSGFTMVGDRLYYEGSELEAGVYSAYGVITPPAGLGNDFDYDYNVEVNYIVTKGVADSLDKEVPVTSEGLLIGLVDDEAPVITPVINSDNTTTNVANYDVNIVDKISIVEVKVYEGAFTLEELLPEFEEVEFSVGEDYVEFANNQDMNVDMDLLIETVDDILLATGSMTIYARDAFGNEGVLAIEVESEDINDLLDSDLK